MTGRILATKNLFYGFLLCCFLCSTDSLASWDEYQVYPVNSQADTVEGEKCYRSLDELPGPVGGVLTVVPKAEARKVVEDCARLGIKKVWLQQGSESPEAIKLCEEKGISVAHHACIMMYAQPKGFHAFHHFVWKVVGKL